MATPHGLRGESDSLVAALLSQGYEALHRSPAEAMPYFEEALRYDPSNRTAQLQLGSIYLSLDRPEDAITRFEIAHHLRPSDTTALQVAYLASRLGMTLRAYEIFETLQSSSDSATAALARSAVAVMAPVICQIISPWWMRPSATLYYDTRIKDLIFYGWYHLGYFLDDARTLSAFGVASIFADSRSAGGVVPVIYADNYALLGGGLRYAPLAGLTIDLQPGVTYDLLARPGKPRVNFDFRSTISYGNGLYAPVESPGSAQWPFHFFADAYVSAGYYTRYENALLYSHGRAGLRALTVHQTAVDLFLRGDLVVDTRGDYYNNIVEGGGGIRIIPDHRWGLSFIAEYHHGAYLRSVPPSAVLESPYNVVRFFVVFDRFLCW